MYYIFATLWGRSPSKEFFSSFTEFWLGLQPASLWPWPTFSCQLRTFGGGGGRFSVLGLYLGLSVTLPPLEIIYCTKRFFSRLSLFQENIFTLCKIYNLGSGIYWYWGAISILKEKKLFLLFLSRNKYILPFVLQCRSVTSHKNGYQRL